MSFLEQLPCPELRPPNRRRRCFLRSSRSTRRCVSSGRRATRRSARRVTASWTTRTRRVPNPTRRRAPTRSSPRTLKKKYMVKTRVARVLVFGDGDEIFSIFSIEKRLCRRASLCDCGASRKARRRRPSRSRRSATRDGRRPRKAGVHSRCVSKRVSRRAADRQLERTAHVSQVALHRAPLSESDAGNFEP